jgi:epoxide hydrolase 4
MSTTGPLPDVGIGLREGYAEVGDQTLHYVEAGEGPLIVVLHGFPEFWFGWRLQIAPLVAAGFRVVAADTRGYNRSSKPEAFEAYGVDRLADDIRGLIEERGAESALLVGHDWGGSIAWTVAMNHSRWSTDSRSSTRPIRGGCRRDCTTRASSGSPGTSSSLRPRDCPGTWCPPGTGTSSGISCRTRTRLTRLRNSNATYRRGRSQGHAAGMINYYRASVRQSQKEAVAKLRPMMAPMLVIWGERDSYLGSELAEPAHDDVPSLDRVQRLADASPWVHRDEAGRVSQLLIEFLAPAGPTSAM